jgi:hypothetical protein
MHRSSSHPGRGNRIISRCGGIPQIHDASAGWRLLQSYDDTEMTLRSQ